MEVDEQLNEWVKGNSMHNYEKGECCPDFSCCEDINTPLDVRERFAKAHYDGDDETCSMMLMMFLGELLKGQNIYIAGDEPGEVH